MELQLLGVKVKDEIILARESGEKGPGIILAR